MLIYGKNSIIEALNNKRQILKIYLQTGFKDQEVIKKIQSAKIEITYLPVDSMNRRFGTKTNGIAGEIAEYEYTNISKLFNDDKQHQTIVILDSLEDPHNLGAILRSCDATKADAVIIPKNRSVRLNATVAKVSTGAVEYVDVCEVTNLVSTINDLKKHGFWVIGLEIDGSIDYRQQDYQGKIAVVIGSEGKGISRLVKENCDILVNIPMYGKVNSLNASVSAAILLYEILRSRGY